MGECAARRRKSAGGHMSDDGSPAAFESAPRAKSLRTARAVVHSPSTQVVQIDLSDIFIFGCPLFGCCVGCLVAPGRRNSLFTCRVA